MKAIVLEGIGKKFFLSHQDKSEIKSFFSPSGRAKVDEFWSLKDINIEIEDGQIAGIIGRNGAGKSTLLDIIAGVCTPTVGKVTVNGRISSILSLGAGFQGELTGKENIFLNSSILGVNKEQLNKKYRLIAEFSELGSFLDSPIRTYSSGMYLRLGFSVAIHMDFDILLIDEILSVGDVSFQKKCFDKIRDFRQAGKTMIIISQDINIINRMCDEVFLLEKGKIVGKGDPQKVTGSYLELLNEENVLSGTFQRQYDGNINWWADKRFWGKKEGSKEAEIIDVELINSQGVRTNKFMSGEKATLKAHFQAKERVEEPHFGVAIFREDGVYCYGPNTVSDGYKIDNIEKGKGWFSIEYESLSLMPGHYRFSVVIWDKTELWAYDYHAGVYKFEIIGAHHNGQLLNLNYRWSPDSEPQEIRMFPFERQNMFFNLDNKYCLNDKVISSLEFIGLEGNLKDIFHTGEGMEVRMKLQSFEGMDDAYLWTGIFRSDDVCCHAASRRLKETQGIASLIYPSLPLLSGKYYISICLWGMDKKEPLFYSHKARQFNMSHTGRDHGTIYLKHSWRWELV